MTEHVQCACQCIKSSSSCTAARQVWNEHTCGCDCKPAYQEHNLNCTGVSKVWSFYELIYLKQGNPWNCPTNEAFTCCWSLFADEYKTLPKSTRRNVKLKKFVFGSLWLPDLLCKHWFTSSVWNFCRWVADVVPCEKSPAGRSGQKRLYSQVTLPDEKDVFCIQGSYGFMGL